MKGKWKVMNDCSGGEVSCRICRIRNIEEGEHTGNYEFMNRVYDNPINAELAAATFNQKEQFVMFIHATLTADNCSYVTWIKYNVDPESAVEIVTIIYSGGQRTRINVTANSLGAIYKEIGAEVYGDGAFGRIKN